MRQMSKPACCFSSFGRKFFAWMTGKDRKRNRSAKDRHLPVPRHVTPGCTKMSPDQVSLATSAIQTAEQAKRKAGKWPAGIKRRIVNVTEKDAPLAMIMNKNVHKKDANGMALFM